MIKEYGLYDFLMLLQLGLWRGGKVKRLGFLSSAFAVDCADRLPGLTGLRLSNRLMLEACSPSCHTPGNTVIISQYEPHSGTYIQHGINIETGNKEYFMSALQEIIFGTKKKIIWSHQIYQRDPFRKTPRHSGEFRSLRGGPNTKRRI